MSVKSLVLASAVLAVLAACGPNVGDTDWMLDTFSWGGGDVVNPTRSDVKYRFEQDGTGVQTRLSACGRDVSELAFRWEGRGEHMVAIVPDEGEHHVLDTSDEEERRFTLTGRCVASNLEEVDVEGVYDGATRHREFLHRGDSCLERTECPADAECDDCYSIWCAEPPPPCE